MTRKKLELPAVAHHVKPKKIDLPTYWSPQQATAVFEFLDELRDRVLAQYAVQIREFSRQERLGSTPFIPTDTTDDEPPF